MATVFKQRSYLLHSNEVQDKFIAVSDKARNFFNLLPVLDIHIEQRTDLSVSKTLGGNFNYVVFQDMPVVMQITGIYELDPGCPSTGNVTKNTIQELYALYKIGKGEALTVNINGARYEVMAVSLVQWSYQNAQGVMIYKLSMVGSRVGK